MPKVKSKKAHANGNVGCPVSWCGRHFTRSQHIDRHLRGHTGDRPYICSGCHDQFSRADLAMRHFKKCRRTYTTEPIRLKALSTKQACDQCIEDQKLCDGCLPCDQCASGHQSCTFDKFYRETSPSGPGHPPPPVPNHIPDPTPVPSTSQDGTEDNQTSASVPGSNVFPNTTTMDTNQPLHFSSATSEAPSIHYQPSALLTAFLPGLPQPLPGSNSAPESFPKSPIRYGFAPPPLGSPVVVSRELSPSQLPQHGPQPIISPVHFVPSQPSSGLTSNMGPDVIQYPPIPQNAICGTYFRPSLQNPLEPTDFSIEGPSSRPGSSQSTSSHASTNSSKLYSPPLSPSDPSSSRPSASNGPVNPCFGQLQSTSSQQRQEGGTNRDIGMDLTVCSDAFERPISWQDQFQQQNHIPECRSSSQPHSGPSAPACPSGPSLTLGLELCTQADSGDFLQQWMCEPFLDVTPRLGTILGSDPTQGFSALPCSAENRATSLPLESKTPKVSQWVPGCNSKEDLTSYREAVKSRKPSFELRKLDPAMRYARHSKPPSML